jgi:hypothetical protein
MSISSELLKQKDIVLLIEEFLKDKPVNKNSDSYSIENGLISRWSFEQVTKPTDEELLQLDNLVQLKINQENIKMQKLEAGKKAREACVRCLDIIAGHNLEQELTAQQITEMQTTFAPIQSALMTSRPTTAKALIQNLVPDNILVSQELKDLVLAELTDY